MDLHMRLFNGSTFGMSVKASSPAFKRMKRRAFNKTVPAPWRGGKRTFRCVWASDVAAVMGQAGWLVSEGREMETICWDNDPTEYYIIYEEGDGK